MAVETVPSHVFSLVGVLYVVVLKFLTGELNSMDELWEAPAHYGQQSLILPWFLDHIHSLSYDTPSEHKPPLDSTLDHLQQLVQYFSDTVHMNPLLDAYFAVYLIQENLRVLNVSEGSRRAQLDHIMNLAEDFVKRGEETIKITDPKYYAQLGQVLHRGLSVEIPSRLLPNLTYDPSLFQKDNFSEPLSNICMAETLNCSMSSECWSMMTTPYQSGYTLTHQVLYMIAVQTQCPDSNRTRTLMAAGNHTSLLQLNDQLCGYVHYEAGQIVNRNYPEGQRDIFCEQLFFCGILGYSQFFDPVSLENILSWQNPNGCYKYQSFDLYLPHIMAKLGKRSELLRDDLCFPHYTVVCGGAMAMYVRYLNEDPDLNLGSFE